MKKATAIGPEMNELMAKRLSMEDLETVAGGTVEEPDEIGFIPAGIMVAGVLIAKHSLKSFDEFWNWISNHHKVVKGMIWLSSRAFGVAYSFLWDDKARKDFWRDVYNLL